MSVEEKLRDEIRELKARVALLEKELDAAGKALATMRPVWQRCVDNGGWS